MPVGFFKMNDNARPWTGLTRQILVIPITPRRVIIITDDGKLPSETGKDEIIGPQTINRMIYMASRREIISFDDRMHKD